MELLLLVAIVYIIYKLFKPKKTKQESTTSNLSMSDPVVKTLIDEAVTVINDMLNVGKAASIYSHGSDFRGAIICCADPRPRSNCGIQIILLDVKNLEECVDRYPKMWSNPDNLEMNANLADFMLKYGRYHDATQNRYIYHTTHTAQLQSNNTNNDALKALLLNQVENSCPLADISNGIVYTKNVVR